MKLTVMIFALTLTGCSTYGQWVDSRDPCQRAQIPSFCGASGHPVATIRAPQGQITGRVYAK